MSRYKRISYASHSTAKVVDVVFTDPDYVEGKPVENPTRRTRCGNQFTTSLEFDESDVRAIHAKLGEIIAGWDA